MTRQERALKKLVNNVYKDAQKDDHLSIHYPGYYPPNIYFLCDRARILKCSFSEEFPLPSAEADGVEEFNYALFWERSLNANWVRVKLPTLDELEALQLRYDNMKPAFPDDNYGYRCLKKKRAKAVWHFGGSGALGNYFRSDYIAKAIQAMKEPKAFIDPDRKWSYLYICSEPEGTELMILPIRAGEITIKLFYRRAELELYKE